MSSANSIICEEVFDETSSPSIDEIKVYATKLGIDPDNEPELLPLAAEGLMKALPAGWKPIYDEHRKTYYYYNNATGKTQWEHPLDGIYRGIVKKKRSESQSQSLGDQNEDATYNRDDLPSFEENLATTSKTIDNNTSFGAKKKDNTIKLSPLRFDVPKLSKQKSEEKEKSQKIIGLTLSTSFDQFKGDALSETGKKEFKLTRDGSMFLKRKGESPERPERPAAQQDDQPRGILRERTFTIDPLDDDRKNVRFSLNVETQLKQNENFSLRPATSAESIEINNLKLVKPNPGDFTDSKLKSESSAPISDSEDDSILKSLDGKKQQKEFKLGETKTDDVQERRKNEELERMLTNEKSKYEENIKSELENLRIEMESRNLRALEQERLKLEEELKSKKEALKTEIESDVIVETLRADLERKTNKLKKSYEDKFLDVEKELNRDLERRKDELIVQHNAILDQIKKQHQTVIENLKQDFKSEEKIIRKEHEHQINELKKKVNGNLVDNEASGANHGGGKDSASCDDRLYEKVRCEKRLLEDKYRCLKEKYLKLKTDVKLSIDKRNRRREQSTTNTTGSETERSNSLNKERSPNRSKPPVATTDANSNTHLKPETKTAKTVLIRELDTSLSDRSFDNKASNVQQQDSSEDNDNAARGRKKLYTRVKSASAGRNNLAKSKRNQRTCSPVENLRRQLQKLEDLEDQLPPPHPPQSDTYHLRYPFSDGQKFEGSSELEFFRHRIHLERDSIKRAKESLRTQKCLFQQRQKDLKLKHGTMARHTLQQLCQEEKDLTDMEVSLHRTRSLLGEKVIRLRHLEQSLQRATAASSEPNKHQDETLSDLSSHSASSGISSTEFATAADGFKTLLRGEHLQESSEIIQSLENLNLEIREIWEVLNQQQKAGNMASVLSAVPLVYPDLGWPMLAGTASVPAPPSIPTLADRLHNYRQHVALANAQSTVVTHAANQAGATTTLVERTRNLRHWLRQAGIDPNVDGVAPQATL